MISTEFLFQNLCHGVWDFFFFLIMTNVAALKNEIILLKYKKGIIVWQKAHVSIFH